MALTRAILQSAVDAEAEKWKQRPAAEVHALFAGDQRFHNYELEVSGSGVSFDLELLGVRDEAVDLLLQAQPIDEADTDAIRVPRAPGQKGGWSEEELGIASDYFWIDRK